MTALTLITRALRTIGVVGAGDVPTAADGQDGLTAFNALLSAWRLDRLTVLQLAREAYTLTNGTAAYTIGSGGAFNRTLVPVSIDHASCLLPAGTVEYPVEVLTAQRWAHLTPKTEAGGQVTALRYQPAATLGTITVWPVPDTTGLQLVLYLPTPLASFATLATDVALPDGYEDAYIYNLAKRLCPEYGKVIPPDLRELAAESLAAIRRVNVEPAELRLDPALRGQHWDVDTGEFR